MWRRRVSTRLDRRWRGEEGGAAVAGVAIVEKIDLAGMSTNWLPRRVTTEARVPEYGRTDWLGAMRPEALSVHETRSVPFNSGMFPQKARALNIEYRVSSKSIERLGECWVLQLLRRWDEAVSRKASKVDKEIKGPMEYVHTDMI